MPFVDVIDLEYESTQPDQYTWFNAVLKMLYSEKARLTEDELHYCLLAFWCHHRLLDPKLKITKMWKWHIPMAMKSIFEWEDVCQYWDMEFHKAIFLNEPFNEFIFDLFCKMLSHNGFCNDDHPFFLGYVTAKFKTKVSGGNVFNICYQLSWKKLDHKACICYVGQVRNMFYPIIPKSDYQPQHRTRATTKGKDIWCEIFLAAKLLPPYKLKLKDDSSGSETDEDGEMEKLQKVTMYPTRKVSLT